jgi:SOS response regulatory protein OraA/RecX
VKFGLDVVFLVVTVFGTEGETSVGQFSLRESHELKLRQQLRERLFGELLEMGFEAEAIERVMSGSTSKNKEALVEALARGSAREEEEKGREETSQTGGALEQLVGMGFDPARADEALQIMGGEMQAAIDFLMTQSH